MMLMMRKSLRDLTLQLPRPAGRLLRSVRRSGMALVLRSDGVVLPRGPGRRHGPPRQEPQEMVGGASVQGLALERLHASRRLAAARRHQQQEEEEERRHQPPRRLRQWPPRPAATGSCCLEKTAGGHGQRQRGASTWSSFLLTLATDPVAGVNGGAGARSSERRERGWMESCTCVLGAMSKW
ncbi:hypothetical protein PAHAL_1G259600 [Panicum hallii]|uniref:Uncharacterized protein n=1 Tax=Panicum hallii TaxID=206008 RepID=A0A2T8KWE7_9POAL|nr:hypothetical protein PAHAL_1G259600 [Panicum hallii]